MNNKVMKAELVEIDKSLIWARDTVKNMKINLAFLIDDLEKARFNLVNKIGRPSKKSLTQTRKPSRTL